MLFFFVFEVLEENGQEQVHEEEVSDDHKHNEVRLQGHVSLSANIVMHHKLPVLSYQAHKDTHEGIEEVVEVLPWRESVWVILGHYLVESIDGGLVPK